MDNLTSITSPYKKQFIDDILNRMKYTLDNQQLMELNKSLNTHTTNLVISENPNNIDFDYEKTNISLIKNFIKTKKLKGLSVRTCEYYEMELNNLMEWCIKSFLEINSEDLKEYLRFKESKNNCGKVTVNNVRRVISSFFKYLENEELIIINPVRAIPAIKEPKRVRKAYTDEEVEKMRDVVNQNGNYRNIAIFEMLISSGLRISELLSLKIDDLSLVDCKGVCLGKGNKQRVFYFSEKAKLSVIKYLENRNDENENPYLFIQDRAPYNQLGVSGAGTMILNIGKQAGIQNVHPHRFRRTLATRLIRKGMEIDQVSKILGHESLGITQRYIESDRDMLELTHKKHVN